MCQFSLINSLKQHLSSVCAATILSACAALPVSSADAWKEEVLLHDGQKIVVERSQIYKGRREPGQEVPAGEHTIRFALPGSNRQLSWTSEYGQDLGRTNFNALALHVKQGVPYLVVEPNLCLSYNKWGRPNPPYVVFKLEANEWQRIAIADLPQEFKTINLIVNDNRQKDIRENSQSSGYVPFVAVQRINSSLPQPQYKTILREVMGTSGGLPACEIVVRYKCGWGAPGEFNRQYFENSCK